MNLIRAACVVAISMASVSTMAAESVDLGVIGQIAPGTCNPSFANGGEISFGDIQASALSSINYNPLGAKELGFSIVCDAPTKVSFKPMSMRKGTALGAGAEDEGGFARSPINMGALYSVVAGLNLDGSGNKIGGLSINMDQGVTTIDGSKDVDALERRTANGSFVKRVPALDSFAYFSYAWGAKGSVEPLAFRSLSSKMKINAFLNKRSELDLSEEIKLDGLVTFELFYL